MVSRQTTRPLSKLVPAAALGLAAMLGVVGCGAGQVTQTSSMEPAVNGNTAQLGQIALRDVLVTFPEGGSYEVGDDAPLTLAIINVGAADDELVSVTSPASDNVEVIGDARLPGRTGLQVVVPDDNPAASTTESAESSESSTSSSSPSTTGSATSESSTSESPTGSTTTSSPSGTSESGVSSQPPTTLPEGDGELDRDSRGTISIVLTDLTGELPIGKTVPVTFVFAKAGSVTVRLPIGAPATPRVEPTEEHEEGGH